MEQTYIPGVDREVFERVWRRVMPEERGLDGIYFCPHHPHCGYKGEIKELKFDCDCRKPKPGMLLKAAEDFNIDLSQSWMIGDGEHDVKAGKNAGCKTCLIVGEDSNSKRDCDFKQDITCKSLIEFVGRIL